MPGIALDVPVNKFTGKRLMTVYPCPHARVLSVNFGPSLTLAMGTIVGQAATNLNDVQTMNIGGTPTGGTFTINVSPFGAVQTTGLIAYNAAAAGTETGHGTVASPYVSVQGALIALLARATWASPARRSLATRRRSPSRAAWPACRSRSSR